MHDSGVQYLNLDPQVLELASMK